jgi:hypothetical protein
MRLPSGAEMRPFSRTFEGYGVFALGISAAKGERMPILSLNDLLKARTMI